MRRHRVALTFTPALVAGIFLSTNTGTAAPRAPQEATWTRAEIPPTTHDTETILREHHQLTGFYRAVEGFRINRAHEVADQFQVAAADEAAATTTTTSAPATTSGAASTGTSSATQSTATDAYGSNASIWACIIDHESGGDPSAVNQGSGAGGLFQFELGTWQANGGTGEPQDASTAEQWAIAEATQASEGWSPWIGDGCTPLG